MIIAQITDTHITLGGRQRHDLQTALIWLNAMEPRPALILLSGDTVNNGRLEQYERLRDIIAGSAVNVFVVPGNHDRRSILRSGVPAKHYPGAVGESITYVLDTAPVRIVALDTSDTGRPGGILDDARLSWLDSCLSDSPRQPTLIFMHHPPFRTGVNLADMFGFAGLRKFQAIVTRHRQVRRIIAGHVHCERHTTIGQAHATTGISSTPQMVPELFERRLIALRPEPAGFTLHVWESDTFRSMTYVQAGDGRFVPR